MTLHEALVLILLETTNQPMTVRQLADGVTERGLYRRRDGSPVEVKKEHAMSGPGGSRASRRTARRAVRREYPRAACT